MIDPCTLSDRALKILLILWQAATALSTDQIMATYAQRIGRNSIRIALMELESKQLVSRLGYRDGWSATPNSRQLVLGESSATELSSVASSSLDRGTANNFRELLLARGNESAPAELSFHKTSIPVDNSPEFVDNLKTCYEHDIREPTASEIAAMTHVTPEYITAHVMAQSEEDLPLAIWRIKNNWQQPKRKHKSRTSRADYLAYLEE